MNAARPVDFFARQEDARRRSVQLIVLFCLAVIGVALAVYLLAAVIRLWISYRHGMPAGLWDAVLFFWTTLGTICFIALTSLWKIHGLRSGGAGIALSLGGKPVAPQTSDPRERALRNVVEEMSIAAGIPVPDLFLLERELGINAFAAGHGVDDAAVCVTRGAVELLSRDELQGVVAHEFSHILNGDMLLNLRLLGWLNGILAISQAGEVLLRAERLRAAGIGVALYAVGYLGYFFGRLIKCAVSRQREYLGDASAVQFTRNPEGVAGALKKIGGLSAGSLLTHPRAPEVSHMFFGSGLREAWLHALDTHPPLDERIRRIEPRFNGIYPRVEPLPPLPVERTAPPPKPAREIPAPAPALTGMAVAALLDQVGQPMQRHIDMARQLLAELPEPLTAASRDLLGATALVYGLLLDRDPAIRERQVHLVETQGGSAVGAELCRLIPYAGGLEPRVRLPLLDLSLPALRSLGPEQFKRLKEVTEALITADGRVSPFEFALRYLLIRRLEIRHSARPARPIQIYGIRGVLAECSCILTTMARVGHADESAARSAFDQGVMVLREPKAEFSFLPAAEYGMVRLEQALAALERVSPLIKRRLLAACLECLVHDGVVKVDEIELFRAIADALGCPVPPWLDAGPVQGESTQQ